jgi:HSP20 family protein
MRTRTYGNYPSEAVVWNNVMNRFFNNLAGEYSRNGGTAGSDVESNENGNGFENVPETLLPIDLWATTDNFQVNAYLPGVNPEDVEITFEGDELLIRGKLPAAPEGENFVRRELYHGTFLRRLNFNVPVDADRIEAHFHNGLLTLTIPKAEAIKPKQIKIQSK